MKRYQTIKRIVLLIGEIENIIEFDKERLKDSEKFTKDSDAKLIKAEYHSLIEWLKKDLKKLDAAIHKLEGAIEINYDNQ